MNFRYEINKRLSQEHHNVNLDLKRLDSILTLAGSDAEPDWSDPDTRRLMGDLQSTFESGIPNHFAIEEEELFPLLRQNGLGDMVDLLLEEHRIILDLIKTVLPIISQAATETKLGKEDWKILFEIGDELVSALSMHAEKEESGLIPAIDQMIDQANADRIFRSYQEK